MATKFMSLDGENKEENKTVFEKIVTDAMDVRVTDITTDDYLNVLHIGYDNIYGDVFKCWDKDYNDFAIVFGTKGDEFK